MTTAPDKSCAVCGRDPDYRNNSRHECAVVDCPHRGRARQYDDRPRPEAWGGKFPPLDLLDDINEVPK